MPPPRHRAAHRLDRPARFVETAPPRTRSRRANAFSARVEGALAGAIPVPPDGQPMILGSDGPVTGGYPVVAVVADASRDAPAHAHPRRARRHPPGRWSMDQSEVPQFSPFSVRDFGSYHRAILVACFHGWGEQRHSAAGAGRVARLGRGGDGHRDSWPTIGGEVHTASRIRTGVRRRRARSRR
ncbi:MAG: hypothetical protein QM677_04650 [Microbacterium sp.]